MANEDEAAELAKRAGRQGRHAARNLGKAAATAAEPALDNVEELAGDVTEAAKRLSPRVLGRISSDTGVGFLALSVAVYAGVLAANKFRQAAANSGNIIN